MPEDRDAANVSGRGESKIKPSAGAKHLIDACNMQILAEGESIMPGSATQRPGFKLTADAARLQNARKGSAVCCSIVLQLLCHGVYKDDWTNAVRYMVSRPQSCVKAFVLRLWFGKDDAPNMKAHATGYMEESVGLEEEGMESDLPQRAPPWSYTRAPRTGNERITDGKRIKDVAGEGTLNRRELDEKPGTTANGGHRSTVREWLVTAIKLLPVFMLTYDGATTLAMTGVSLRSNYADPFTSEETDEMGSFHRIVCLKRGRSLTHLCEDLWPGCSDASSKDHWRIKYVCEINAKSRNSELQAVTREPPRQEESGMGKAIGQAAKKLQKIMGRAGDGRVDTRQPYEDADMRRLKYDHAAFVPGINGDDADAATKTRQTDCLVRMPVVTSIFERELPNAAWKGMRACETKNILGVMGLCIIHCAMRTLESCLKLLLRVASTRYLAGKGKDRDIVNAKLNDAVWTDLRLRKLISVNEKGELNKVTLNGEEVCMRTQGHHAHNAGHSSGRAFIGQCTHGRRLHRGG